jgi:hypothetical protein
VSVYDRAEPLLAADEPLALKLGEAVAKLRAADVQALGKEAFPRQTRTVAKGAEAHFVKQLLLHRAVGVNGQMVGIVHGTPPEYDLSGFSAPQIGNTYFLKIIPFRRWFVKG